jgi:enoyl-CoA hydratase
MQLSYCICESEQAGGDMSDEVLVERRGAVQVITINRPEARNAINGAVAAGVRELDADAALQVGVLTGAGGTFSSGMDLKAFLKGETPSFPGRGLAGITQTPPRKPMIAAAEGYALAGGFELAMACDLVIAGASAKFGVPEVKRSLVAGAGGALLLARRIPRALALEMLLTGDPFDARRAYEIGLVNRVVDDGQALETALELAGKIAANGPLALMATKEISNGGADWSAAERWDEMARLMGPVFTSQDAQEGARAFAEKRAPVWKGQ